MIKGSWWVDLRANHLRYRKRSPENSRAGALAYESLLRQRLTRGESIDIRGNAQQDETFEQFAWQWYGDYVEANNKFSEQRAKKGMLRRSLIPFFGKLHVDKISVHHLEQYKAQMVKSGVAQKTMRNRLTALNKCLSCAYEWRRIAGSPPKVKWPKCPMPKTDYLTPEECDLLLSNSSGIIYEMILTALRTGMRQGELKGLQWQSIDWQSRTVAIRHSYCDVRRTLDTPKSNRERHIPLDIDVLEMLHKRKQNAGFVFLDVHKPFNSPRLSKRLAKVCKRAGMRKITWHVLRHTFATNLARMSAPLNAVQTLLGHSSIATTMRYAHVAPSTLRAAIDLLNPKTALDANVGQPVGNRWVLGQQNTSVYNEISSGR
jgi:integrase